MKNKYLKNPKDKTEFDAELIRIQVVDNFINNLMLEGYNINYTKLARQISNNKKAMNLLMSGKYKQQEILRIVLKEMKQKNLEERYLTKDEQDLLLESLRKSVKIVK